MGEKKRKAYAHVTTNKGVRARNNKGRRTHMYRNSTSSVCTCCQTISCVHLPCVQYTPSFVLIYLSVSRVLQILQLICAPERLVFGHFSQLTDTHEWPVFRRVVSSIHVQFTGAPKTVWYSRRILLTWLYSRVMLDTVLNCWLWGSKCVYFIEASQINILWVMCHSVLYWC
jgi:hypothetical protein